jgi:archaemetzincin
MKSARWCAVVSILAAMLGLTWWLRTYADRRDDPRFVDAPPRPEDQRDAPLKEVEDRLRPIAEPKRLPGPHDWLANHLEGGQTFAAYRSAGPVGPDASRRTIYLALIGEFSAEQRRVLELTRDYMERFFGMPTKVAKTIPVPDLPGRAWRTHPEWGTRQLLTGYVLGEVLEATRPEDALAYLAFTAADLTPGEGWNFVFGQANLRERVGAWSMSRFGDPARGAAEFRLCLSRTMDVASHETGHIFTIQHCTAFECNMNGSNSLEESDRAPLHACPVCTRKLCWDLKLDPVARFERLVPFYRANGFGDEADWCTKAVGLLKAP